MTLRPARVAALSLTASLLFTSCVTTALWNGSFDGVYDDESGRFDFEPRASNGAELVAKLLATPLTAAFDLCTSPVQALMYDGNPDPLIDLLSDGDALACFFD